MSRIGVFVCHCGENIGRTVDCARVAEALGELPGVAHSVDYKYMCSDPGQLMIKQAIAEKGLTASSWRPARPHMHEKTFRRAAAGAGLNPFLCEMANIREHCSWIHEDREAATEKAIDLRPHHRREGQAQRPARDDPHPGGAPGAGHRRRHRRDPGRARHRRRRRRGGAGREGAVHRRPHEPALRDLPDARLLAVHPDPADGRGLPAPADQAAGLQRGRGGRGLHRQLQGEDPAEGAERRRDEVQRLRRLPEGVPRSRRSRASSTQGSGKRTAIYVPFPQAVPNIPVIDRESCAYFKGKARRDAKKDACGKCKEACARGAIDFEQEDAFVTEKVGAIVVATGYQLYSIGKEQTRRGVKGYGEYGYGTIPDVIDGLQFERLASASGPTGGKILRPSDGKEPKRIVFLQCVGLARPGQGDRLLLEDLLHVRRQAHDALPAQGARRRRRRSSTWTSAPPARGTTSSCAARSRRTAPSTSAAASRGMWRDGDVDQGPRLRHADRHSRWRSTPTWSSSRRRCGRSRGSRRSRRSSPSRTTGTASSTRRTRSCGRSRRTPRASSWRAPARPRATSPTRSRWRAPPRPRSSGSSPTRCSSASRPSRASTRRSAPAASTASGSARTARSSTRRSATGRETS